MTAPLPELVRPAFARYLARGDEPPPLPDPPAGPGERELPWDEEEFPDDEYHPRDEPRPAGDETGRDP